MKHWITIACVLAFIVMSAVARAEVQMGQVPPTVELKEGLGGHLDGTPWSSDEMKGKVCVLFYVDPDKKDLNNDASEALAAEKFPRDKFQSLAIINMAATWLPNFAISSSLKEKQKKYPHTLYVRDNDKVLVKEWNIADDSSDVLAFDKQGRLVFRKDGKLNADDIQQLLTKVKENL